MIYVRLILPQKILGTFRRETRQKSTSSSFVLMLTVTYKKENKYVTVISDFGEMSEDSENELWAAIFYTKMRQGQWCNTGCPYSLREGDVQTLRRVQTTFNLRDTRLSIYVNTFATTHNEMWQEQWCNAGCPYALRKGDARYGHREG